MEARHHAGHDVDGQRDPRPPGGLASGLVDDDDIDLCVINLHNLKRPRDLIGPGRCPTCTNQARLTPTSGTSAFVDAQQPGLDGPPGGHGKTLLTASCGDVRDNSPQRWPGWLQILPFQELPDQRVPDWILAQATLGSTQGLLDQGFDCAGGAVARNKPIQRRTAQPELPGYVLHRLPLQPIRMTQQQSTDCLLAAASLRPGQVIFGDTVRHRPLTLQQRAQPNVSYSRHRPQANSQ